MVGVVTSLLFATILGPPVPFARPRFVRGRVFQEPRYAAWRERAALAVRAAAVASSCGVLARQPLELRVYVYHQRPARRPEGIERGAWRSTVTPCPAITRCDLDNVIKACGDAVQGSGVIADDRWLVRVVASSYYAMPGEGPHVDVAIHAVG
jgi:Holliday junction resolvase RusA-like endonuclease